MANGDDPISDESSRPGGLERVGAVLAELADAFSSALAASAERQKIAAAGQTAAVAAGLRGPLARRVEHPGARRRGRSCRRPNRCAAEGAVTAAGLCQAGGQGRPNPLLTGLIGLVAGAALATLLPATRRERQLVARAREDLWRQAEALGHQTAARVRDLGRCSTASAADRSSVK
jgi:hypothetical protein